MRDLPSGTVTFLFTDVEGSTKLLHELAAPVLAVSGAEFERGRAGGRRLTLDEAVAYALSK